MMPTKGSRNGFSPKQLKVMTWWYPKSSLSAYDGIICDGAVRSGKSFCMSLSFVFWAFCFFNNASFGICGKAITSVRRNMIQPLSDNLKSLGFTVEYKLSTNLMTVRLGKRCNRFYVFGGRDESSASLIQGITLSGVLLDEVALMPRSFVEQAIARCSVSGSRLWFNCNPDNPNHWFYTEWIKKAEDKNILYLHFKMEDNPSLSKKIIGRYRRLYSGSFYERFVEGKWVSVDGLVYPMFSSNDVIPVPDVSFERYYISCDYGTVNPASFGLWGEYRGKYYRIDEYYYDSKRVGTQLTDEEYYTQLEKLSDGRKIEKIVVDPSAASFITLIKRKNKYKVVPAKNDVLDGIRLVASALKTGKIAICKPCADAVREFSLYRWEQNGARDCPRKENDHSMDEIRYFVSSVVEKEESPSFFALSAER